MLASMTVDEICSDEVTARPLSTCFREQDPKSITHELVHLIIKSNPNAK